MKSYNFTETAVAESVTDVIDIKNPAYLTPPQKSIDDMNRFFKGTSISTLCGAVIFDEKLDRNILLKSVEILINKHQAFRLRFCTKNGKTMQYVSREWNRKVNFEKFDSEEQIREYGENLAHKSFGADNSEMFIITVFELSENSGVMLCASHLISDAWTYSILAKDTLEIYNNLLKGENIDIQTCCYTDYIKKYEKYKNSEKHNADRSYWLEKYSRMKNIEETPIRVCRVTAGKADSERYTDYLTAEISYKADEFCRENRISLSVLFESAVLIYLSKINRENHTVTIGVPVLGRSNAREKSTAGMFVSTIPLTVQLDEDESVISVCKKITVAHKEIFRHREVSFDEILSEIREKTNFSGRLYDVMVSCQNAKTNIKAKTKWFSNGYCQIPVVFHIDNRDSLDRYTLTVDYQKEIFPYNDNDEIKLITERIKHIIFQIITNGQIMLKDISIIPDCEYKKIVYGFNRTYVKYDDNKCVHTAFGEVAEKNPEKTALVFRNKKYTYFQLDKMSDALAHFLADNGIVRGDIVPVIAHRSPFIIIAMLGILKAGGAYMPVSPDFPTQRIEFMVENVSAKMVLTCGFDYSDCKKGKFNNEISLDNLDYSYKSATHLAPCKSDDICYVIFTSGSTGKPKGTAITHRNVMNYCSENKFNVMGKIIKQNDVSIVSVTNFVFDIFVTESILPLLNGIKIYLADDQQAVSQKALNKLICDEHIEIIQTTPTKMRSFLFDKNECGYLSELRTIILGGEEFSEGLFSQLRKYTSAEIYNIYGPAETTVWSTFTKAEKNNITIGKPVANTHIYILDENSKPVPVGVVGEIYISGDGVGKGYLGNAELTAEKFQADPFFERKIMYRTGDTGLFHSDGNIEFFGRKDFQIKLRGLRIELCEIENVLNGFDGIEHTAVLCRNDKNGEKYLAGYYTSQKKIDEKEIRAYLAEKLPFYMIPKKFKRLSQMPLTASGKINRNALPDITETNIIKDSKSNSFIQSDKYDSLLSKTERKLCLVAAKILGLGKVQIEDDLFDMGADSFFVLEFTAIAASYGIIFSPEQVYRCRNIKQLCLLLSEKNGKKSCRYFHNAKENKSDVMNYPLKRTKSDKRLFEMFVTLTKKIYSFQVTGAEKLDFNRKYIFCPNHQSDLDCMWVWAALSDYINPEDAFGLIAAEHLDKTVSRKVFRIEGGIPVDRKGNFEPSLNRAVSVLKNEKKYLLIHPEGTRTRTGKLGKFKKGAAVISKKTKVQIIPVYIKGAGKIFPVNKKIPHFFDFWNLQKYPLHISFGRPVNPENKTEQQITDEIRQQIIKMKRDEKNDNRNRC